MADTGGQRRACNAHGRERPDAKDEQRVQDNVAHTAHDEGYHGHFHPAHGLEDLLKSQGGHVDRGKAKHDVGI